MNKIINKLISAGDKFTPEIHLKSPGFTYVACGLFTKNKEKIQKFKETGKSRYIYINELDEACFQHDMAYGDSEDLARRTASDKVLTDEAFNIAKNPRYDGYQRAPAFMIYKFFDKKFSGIGIKSMPNQLLADELHKPFIKKTKRRKIYSSFKDNIWGADSVDMQLISIFDKGIRFLLCVNDIFGKYTWVVPLKDKKGVS